MKRLSKHPTQLGKRVQATILALIAPFAIEKEVELSPEGFGVFSCVCR